MKIVIDLMWAKEYIRYLTIALPVGFWVYRNLILFIKGKGLQKNMKNIEDYNIFHYMCEVADLGVDTAIIISDVFIAIFGSIGLIIFIVHWAWR